MEILGIGFPELIFVLIIAILVLGPRDMQKAGQTLGKWLRAILTSDAWMASQQFSREVKRVNNGLTHVITNNRVDGQIITPSEIFKNIMQA